MSTKVDLTGVRRTFYGTWRGEGEPQLVLLSLVQEPREFHLLQNPQRMTARSIIQLLENSKRETVVESHACAQNAQGWGTRHLS